MNDMRQIEVDNPKSVSAVKTTTVRLVSVKTEDVRSIKMVNQGGINVVTDPYPGPYEVTPTQSTQTLATNNKNMAGNVTINPIPSNYGLITWNGSVLTVS